MFKRRIAFATIACLVGVLAPGAWSQQQSQSPLVVAEIRILGNNQTKDGTILREMSIQVGDTLSERAIGHDRQRIYDLQLFNRVDLQFTIERDSAIVYVIVHERWYVFPFPVIGFKYRDPDNLYYGAGIMHQNFRGRNEKIFAAFAVGFDRWIEASYFNPRLNSDDLFLRTSLQSAKLQNLRPEMGFYDQQRYGVSLLLGKRFGLYQTFSGWINYDVWIVPFDRYRGTLSSSGRDAFLSFGLSYSYDTRDLREYATGGSAYSVTAIKAGLGTSEVDHMRLGFSARTFRKITGDVSIGGRVFGTFTAGGPLPPYSYLYFGYDERIRGYFTRIVEGEHAIGTNVEFRIPILTPRYLTIPGLVVPQFSVLRYGIYAGIFADAGKTWYRSESFSSRRWYAGAGGGLHFLLPYSLILRTEYAWNDRGSGEFVLDIGAAF